MTDELKEELQAKFETICEELKAMADFPDQFTYGQWDKLKRIKDILDE